MWCNAMASTGAVEGVLKIPRYAFQRELFDHDARAGPSASLVRIGLSYTMMAKP